MITVVRSGIYATIQDKGRFGYARYGVPFSGSMDSYAADLANLLLQNSKDAAVIENTYGGMQLQFSAPTFICITGGNFSPKINTFDIDMNQVYAIQEGDVLSFGKRRYGARTYIGVQGGIQTEKVLKSRSQYQHITTHGTLFEGAQLPIKTPKERASNALSKIKVMPSHFEEVMLPCYPGPEYSLLDSHQQKMLKQPFTLSEAYDRVGVRLVEPIANHLDEMLTSGVIPGTVQLTPSGTLIILMRDAQVTGGYPRILQLSDYALAMLSQKLPGQEIFFELQNR